MFARGKKGENEGNIIQRRRKVFGNDAGGKYLKGKKKKTRESYKCFT